MTVTALVYKTRAIEPLKWGMKHEAISHNSETIPHLGQILPRISLGQRWATSEAWTEALDTMTKYWKTDVTSSLVAEIDALLAQLHQFGVILGNQGEIRDYLVQFPDLIEVIPQAVRATLSHFPAAQLFLDVYSDPEIQDQYLVLYVRVQKYDESIIQRIEEAEGEYLGFLTDKQGWLQLSTDFREPEFV